MYNNNVSIERKEGGKQQGNKFPNIFLPHIHKTDCELAVSVIDVYFFGIYGIKEHLVPIFSVSFPLISGVTQNEVNKREKYINFVWTGLE